MPGVTRQEFASYLRDRLDGRGALEKVNVLIEAGNDSIKVASYRLGDDNGFLKAYAYVGDDRGAHAAFYEGSEAHIKPSGDRGSPSLATWPVGTTVEDFETLCETLWPNPKTKLRFFWFPKWTRVIDLRPEGIYVVMERVFNEDVQTGVRTRAKVQKMARKRLEYGLAAYDPIGNSVLIGLEHEAGRAGLALAGGDVRRRWEASNMHQEIMMPTMKALDKICAASHLTILQLRTRHLDAGRLQRLNAAFNQLVADYRQRHGTYDGT